MRTVLAPLVLFSALLAGVVSAQECGGGNPCGATGDPASQPNLGPSTGAGNPIDVISGDKYVREVDVDFPGALSLAFVRHYNSAGVTGGAIGGGWSHSYETVLARTRRNAEITVEIVQGDGRRLRFKQAARAGESIRRFDSLSGYGVVEEHSALVDQLLDDAARSGARLANLRPWVWIWPDGRRLTFDGRGVLKRIETPAGERLVMEHDSGGRLTKVSDAFGRSMQLEYWDEPSEVLRAYGSDAVAGGERRRLKSLSLAGRRIDYLYDAHGLLSEVRESGGAVRRYEYVQSGEVLLLAKRWGRNGRLAAAYAYDERGRAISSARGAESLSLEYRDGGAADLNEVWVRPAGGGEPTVYRWRTAPGEDRQLVEAVGAGCASCPAANVRYRYDANGQVEQIDRLSPNDAAQVIASQRLERDALGRLTARYEIEPGERRLIERYVYPDDHPLAKPMRIERPSIAPGRLHVFSIAYNARGQPTRLEESGYAPTLSAGVFEELARVTTYSYFEREHHAPHLIGKLRSVDGPLPGGEDRIDYEYGEVGELRRIVYGGAAVERFDYDANARLISHTPLDGVMIELGYDAEGRLARLTRAGLSTEVRYDAQGRLAVIRDPIGQQFTLGYDDASRMTSITDSANNRIVLQLDQQGRPVARRLLNPDGSVSQEIQSTPEQIAAATLQPQPWSPALLSLIRLPALKPWESKAEALIRPALRPADLSARRVTDPRGLSSDYAYDDFGRLAYVHNPDAGVMHLQYDAADRVVARRLDEQRTIRYEYDALGRPVRAEARDETTLIEYGAHHKPERIRHGVGEDLFGYDAAARLISRTQLIDGKRFTTRYEYDALGRLSEVTLPGGQTLVYRYNASVHAKPGVLTAVERKDLLGATPIVTGLNEAADRFDLQTSRFGNGLEFRRRLDRRGRLIEFGTPGVAQYVFDIDEDGRIARTSGAFAGEFSYDPAGRLSAVAGVHPNGARASLAFGFDDNDNLRMTQGPHGAVLFRVEAYSNRVIARRHANGEEEAYRYDAAGRTTEIGDRRFEYDGHGRLQTITQAGRPLAQYAYNAFGERIRKVVYSGDQRRVTYFFYDGGKLTAQADQSGRIAQQFVYVHDRLAAALIEDEIYAVHTDWRGTPLAATDEDQRMVWRAQADVLGRISVAHAAFQLNLRGSNQYYDAESGLHYNTHRYFDPQASRYLTPDPIGQQGGLNLYAFVQGDPANLIDLLGLQATPTWEEDRALPRNTSVVDWNFERRLRYVFNTMAELYPGEVAEALRELVSPGNLALTAGIFTVWAAAHATPAGWAADLVIGGVALIFMGRAVLTIIATAFDVARRTTNASCLSDLHAAASTLGEGLGRATVEFGSGLAVGGAARTASAIRQLLRRRPSNVASPHALPNRPPPPPPQALGSLIGRRLFGPSMSRIPRMPRNDGVLGEQIAKQILEELSGGVFRGIHNASNHGPDLIRINAATRTIEHIEVKSSQVGAPGWPTGNLAQRFDDWMAELVTQGTLHRQPVSVEGIQYARYIQRLRSQGFRVEHRVMQVTIPPANSTGMPIAELFSWP